ncbi:MAG: hypothetical protein UE068_04925 [Paludibacteraceae bacterium]|jgi:hypothetical protein|nr:hypothetical protein [Paludibacteraceae bacterium]MBR6110844.1 hypothetical protein [Paludibacteraceae bacterium]MEE0083542.1 hypothetical protein [Paludibacteraceae bacterium]MEE1259791.1 hypothetical protein [Paludibacteraceae bacterium]
MKRIVFNIALLSAFSIVSAQNASDSTNTASATDTTIKRNIEVVRDYTPVIKEAGKINTMPELKDVNTKKIEVDYKVWTSTYKPKTDIIPSLDYALASQEENKYSREGFLRLGGGNYKSFLGELYTPIYNSDVALFDFYLKHNSSFGNVTLKKDNYDVLSNDVLSKGLYNDNKARISFLRSIRIREISAFGEFGYNRFNYYGLNSDMISFSEQNKDKEEPEYKNDDQKNSHLTAALNFRFRSKDYIEQWKYDLQTNWRLLKTHFDVAENTIFTDLAASYRMQESILSLKFQMYNVFVSTPENGSIDFSKAQNFNNFTVLKFNPYYSFISEVGRLNLGLKASFGINQGKNTAFSPDITGQVRVIDNIWYVYAGVTGDYKVNTLRSLANENIYLSPDARPEDTYIPLDIYLGTKLNIGKSVNTDIHIGYKIINNQYFYVNKSDSTGMKNTFDVVYDKNVGQFNCGAAVNYNFREKVDFSFKIGYNKWSLEKQKEAWMLPAAQIGLGVSYVPTDFLRFNINYDLEAGRKAKLGKDSSVDLKNFNDISLGANYKLMSFLDVFARFNNILNQRSEFWYGYPSQGFNFLLGLTLTF